MATTLPDEAAAAAADALKAVKMKALRTDGVAPLPDPKQVAAMHTLRTTLDRFERQQAAAPLLDDVEQLKDFVQERTKKLKASMVTLQGQMERRFDVRLRDHLAGFDTWQANLTEVTSGRCDDLDGKIREGRAEVSALRGTTSADVLEVHDAAKSQKEWASREFGACADTSQDLQGLLDKVTRRVSALENSALQRQLASDAANEALSQRIDGVCANFVKVEARHVQAEKRLAKLETAAELAVHGRAALDVELTACTVRLKIVDDATCAMQAKVLSHSADMTRADKERLALRGDVDSASASAALVAADVEARFEGVTLAAQGLANRCVDLGDKLQIIDVSTRGAPEQLDRLDERLDEEAQQLRDLVSANVQLRTRCDAAEAQQRLVLEAQVKLVEAAEKTEKTDVLLQHFEERQGQLLIDLKTEQVAARETVATVAAVAEELGTTKEVLRRQTVQVEQHIEVLREKQAKAEQATKSLERYVKNEDTPSTADPNAPEPVPQMPTTGPGGVVISANKRVSMARRAPAAQLRYVENESAAIVHACRNYMTLCGDRGLLLSVPDDAARTISDTAIEMAAFIAERIDVWAIEELVQERPNDAKPPFSDDDVAVKKRDEQLKWIGGIQAKVEAWKFKGLEASAAQVRIKAREKFLQRTAAALGMALSKHDQVLVSAHSMVRRTALPTCVACDRPLPLKKAGAQAPTFAATVVDDVLGASSAVSALGMDRVASPMDRVASPQRRDRANTDRAGASPKAGASPQTGPRATTAPDPGPKYIYRGGFKMPRKPGDVSSSLPRLHSNSVSSLNLSTTPGEGHQDRPQALGGEHTGIWSGEWN